MATYYSFFATPPKDGTWGKIEFSTDSSEMYSLAAENIKALVDAMSWRNRVQLIGETIDTSVYDEQ